MIRTKRKEINAIHVEEQRFLKDIFPTVAVQRNQPIPVSFSTEGGTTKRKLMVCSYVQKPERLAGRRKGKQKRREQKENMKSLKVQIEAEFDYISVRDTASRVVTR